MCKFRHQEHSTYVFTYDGKPYYSMNSSSWRRGRIRANLPHVRVHDLKHTFGARLTSAGVSLENKKQLLGHRGSVDITTHYSLAGIETLIKQANKVCIRKDDISVASFLKQLNANARKSVGNIIPFTHDLRTPPTETVDVSETRVPTKSLQNS